jgi:hypothetical protein
MPRPAGKWKNVRHPCTVCVHPQRWRIDFLLVTADGTHGTGRRAIAKKFGFSDNAIYRHSNNCISDEYRRTVLAGPFRSEMDLRELAAEEGQSVLVNYRAVFNGHRSRWLYALECGDDQKMVLHGRAMSEMLWKIGQLTREIAPAPTTAIQNIFMTSDYYNFERRALKILRRHPEALQDWLVEFRSDTTRVIEPAPDRDLGAPDAV